MNEQLFNIQSLFHWANHRIHWLSDLFYDQASHSLQSQHTVLT